MRAGLLFDHRLAGRDDVPALAALIGAHLYLVAKLGTTAPPWQKVPESESNLHEDRV